MGKVSVIRGGGMTASAATLLMMAVTALPASATCVPSPPMILCEAPAPKSAYGSLDPANVDERRLADLLKTGYQMATHGTLEEAARHFSEAIAFAPDDERARQGYCWINLRLAHRALEVRNDSGAGAGYLNRAKAACSGHADMVEYMGHLRTALAHGSK